MSVKSRGIKTLKKKRDRGRDRKKSNAAFIKIKNNFKKLFANPFDKCKFSF